jgi:endo-1,4-beta-D-glucanase Y
LTFIVLFLLGLAGRTPAAARFPFPRRQAYPFGIVSTLATPGGAEVQTNFQAWRDSSSGYYRGYVEHGDYAYIDAGLMYHSSELAYGMLVMVMMDNSTNNTQPKFDKLLATYDLRLDSNGLMSWRTRVNAPKPDTVVGYYAATDADLDAALALLLANKQWADDRYLTRAKALITNIWDHELDSTGNLLKPGDDWDKYKNPSYLNFAAFRLFEQVDKGHDWMRIEEASWKLLQANTTPPNSTSRLPTDWCAPDGTPVRGNRSGIDFDYDAIRVPLRAGLATNVDRWSTATSPPSRSRPPTTSKDIPTASGPATLPVASTPGTEKAPTPSYSPSPTREWSIEASRLGWTRGTLGSPNGECTSRTSRASRCSRCST